MSLKDAKTSRQLSLLLALRTAGAPLTKPAIQESVEGYQDMTDAAFMRRFYSDRQELVADGYEVVSGRDYESGIDDHALRNPGTLAPGTISQREYALIAAAGELLGRDHPYASLLALACCSMRLAVDECEESESPPELGVELPVFPDSYAASLHAGKIVAAIRAGRSIEFFYETPHDTERHVRVDPLALELEGDRWFLYGSEHGRETIVRYRLGRIRSAITFSTRMERDFTPSEELLAQTARERELAPWLRGGGERELASVSVTAQARWWAERVFSAAPSDDGELEIEYASDTAEALAALLCRESARVTPLRPSPLTELVRERLERALEAHTGAAATLPGELVGNAEPQAHARHLPARPSMLALAATLLAELASRGSEEVPVAVPITELEQRYMIDRRTLSRLISATAIVCAGVGEYAIHAELEATNVLVERELLSEVASAAPALAWSEREALRHLFRLFSPLLQRALGEGGRSPEALLASVSHSGACRMADVASRQTDIALESIISDYADALTARAPIELELLSTTGTSSRFVVPRALRLVPPHWIACATEGASELNIRLDLVRTIRRLPTHVAAPATVAQGGEMRRARILHSPAVARERIERGARPLEGGYALELVPLGTCDRLADELLALGGGSVALDGLVRRAVVRRARAALARINRSTGRRRVDALNRA